MVGVGTGHKPVYVGFFIGPLGSSGTLSSTLFLCELFIETKKCRRQVRAEKQSPGINRYKMLSPTK